MLKQKTEILLIVIMIAAFFAIVVFTDKFYCDSLPTTEEVENTLMEHNDTVEWIKALNPGNIFVDVDILARCPGKSIIRISYATVYDLQKIKSITGGTFYGVPYRTVNI
jgi:hypothetical protein